MQWLNDPEKSRFTEQYTRAREEGIDASFDELLDTAQAALQAEGAVEVAARRLIVDTQKWRLSKLAPKKYGDKLAIGGDDESPIQHNHTINISFE